MLCNSLSYLYVRCCQCLSRFWDLHEGWNLKGLWDILHFRRTALNPKAQTKSNQPPFPLKGGDKDRIPPPTPLDWSQSFSVLSRLDNSVCCCRDILQSPARGIVTYSTGKSLRRIQLRVHGCKQTGSRTLNVLSLSSSLEWQLPSRNFFLCSTVPDSTAVGDWSIGNIASHMSYLATKFGQQPHQSDPHEVSKSSMWLTFVGMWLPQVSNDSGCNVWCRVAITGF